MHREQIASVEVQMAGDAGPAIVLVGGPPVGAVLFAEIQKRLLPRRSVALDLLVPQEGENVPPHERIRRVLEVLSPAVVVGHGLAVPVVCRVPGAHLTVLSNGPLRQLDPVTRTLASLPGPVLCHGLLRPGVLRPWLASSLGMRRAVVNPYVMEREVVDQLTASLVANRASRRAAALWLKGLSGSLPISLPTNSVAVWGDSDPFHPVAVARELLGADRVHSIVGGRWFHPQERPWAMADACGQILDAWSSGSGLAGCMEGL